MSIPYYSFSGIFQRLEGCNRVPFYGVWTVPLSAPPKPIGCVFLHNLLQILSFHNYFNFLKIPNCDPNLRELIMDKDKDIVIGNKSEQILIELKRIRLLLFVILFVLIVGSIL